MRLILGQDRPNHQQDSAYTAIQFIRTAAKFTWGARSFAQNQGMTFVNVLDENFFFGTILLFVQSGFPSSIQNANLLL
jgi:hypothetical protein